MNMGDTHEAVKQAAIAAFVLAGLTLLTVLLAMLFTTGGTLDTFKDPVHFLNIAVFAVCGVGLLRYSRAAALVLFGSVFLSLVVSSIELGLTRVSSQLGVFGIGLVVLYLFWRGMRAHLRTINCYARLIQIMACAEVVFFPRHSSRSNRSGIVGS